MLLVKNGLIWAQNNTKYENGQNSPKQSWENNQIFEYICKFWANIFIRQIFCNFFLDRIYTDIHSRYFFHAIYFWIFIFQIPMVTNIFRYSFVPKNRHLHKILWQWILCRFRLFWPFSWHNIFWERIPAGQVSAGAGTEARGDWIRGKWKEVFGS